MSLSRMLILLVGLSVAFLTGCARSDPPFNPSSRPAVPERPLTTLLKQYTESDAVLFSTPVPEPEAKFQRGMDALTHADRYKNIYNNPSASPDERRWAMQRRDAVSRDAGNAFRLSAEAYARTGQTDKAREIYGVILRTFTGSAYTGLRQSADTEMKHMDERAKRKMEPHE